jgi:hypothetical protein
MKGAVLEIKNNLSSFKKDLIGSILEFWNFDEFILTSLFK